MRLWSIEIHTFEDQEDVRPKDLYLVPFSSFLGHFAPRDWQLVPFLNDEENQSLPIQQYTRIPRTK